MPTAPCSRTTTRTPHACTEYVKKKDGEKEQCILIEIETTGNSFARLTPALCEELYISVGRADIVFLDRFENYALCIYTRSTTRAGSHQLCLLACVVAL